MLAPVVRKLQFCLLGISVLSVAVVVDNEGHVAAVLSVKSNRFEVGFDNRSGPGWCGHLVVWHVASYCYVVDGGEVIACVFLHYLICSVPTTHIYKLYRFI